MGRHADAPVPAPDAPRRRSVWLERAATGLVAGAVLALVLRWTGWSWSASLLLGAAVLAGVPLAAWLAGTVPGPPDDGGRAAAPHDEEP
ncbi:hypothetical protein KIN34_15190 [Cellulomonas sp. DKR-3]|uniref:Uncharacterized protein n=1 Tax=Cellulomonas fulva TaxID=2835530 RepID=A0ABS5U2K3_9CELL|nr:hypothetical protein [Cellulomonas fulva]MBT0995625.1 hypothetical protein [Cellulomonas fulva]